MKPTNIAKAIAENQLVEVNFPRGEFIGRIVDENILNRTCVIEGVWVPNPKVSERLVAKWNIIHVVKGVKNRLFYNCHFKSDELDV